jgi:hypothetical protein
MIGPASTTIILRAMFFWEVGRYLIISGADGYGIKCESSESGGISTFSQNNISLRPTLTSNLLLTAEVAVIILRMFNPILRNGILVLAINSKIRGSNGRLTPASVKCPAETMNPLVLGSSLSISSFRANLHLKPLAGGRCSLPNSILSLNRPMSNLPIPIVLNSSKQISGKS